MEGANGRVRADAGGFWGEFPDQQTADKSDRGCHNRQEPWPAHMKSVFRRGAFSARERRRIADQSR